MLCRVTRRRRDVGVAVQPGRAHFGRSYLTEASLCAVSTPSRLTAELIHGGDTYC